jgi:hypothetical protein
MNARTAAKLTGKDRSTILRAVESGRLSADKDERGQWLIDPAELERVYGQLRMPDAGVAASNPDTYALQVAALTREVELLRETLEHERRTWRETLDHERGSFEEERTFLRGMLQMQTEQVKLLTDERQRDREHRFPTLLGWFRRTS